MIRSILFLIPFAFVTGCGVRGDPVPPDTPPPLGRGEASFSKATQQVKPPAKKKKQRYDDARGSDDGDGSN